MRIGNACKKLEGMKNYVVGILSMFENNLKLFKVEAESPYDAVKKGMLLFCDNNKNEVEWQESEDYPKDMDGLISTYEETPFDVIEI